MAAGSSPPATISASTSLAWVGVSSPAVSMDTSAASLPGSSASAPSTARLCSTWVSTREGSPPAALARQHGELGIHAGDPLVAGVERHQVGLGEVAVVLGLLLGPQRARPALGLVPVAGLLGPGPARPPPLHLAARPLPHCPAPPP